MSKIILDACVVDNSIDGYFGSAIFVNDGLFEFGQDFLGDDIKLSGLEQVPMAFVSSIVENLSHK